MDSTMLRHIHAKGARARRGLLALAIALGTTGAGSAAWAATIASWTFETSQPATAGPHAAEVGLGSASGLHAGASTYSSPAGNGSAHSFSSNAWAVGDYYQFQVSTTGMQGVIFSWDQTASNTGPGHFQLQYSTGGPFTNFGGVITVGANLNPPGFWNATTSFPDYTHSVDLSSVTALNNAASIILRLSMADT